MRPHYQDDLVTLLHGDCRQAMAALPDCSVDAVVTDPPYELAFMGKGWDASGIAYDPDVWAQAYRVIKPGGHLLAFGGTRTWHRLAAAIEDAGFEVRDSIAWMYGSGFPKSLDVSKAIDRMKHDRHEVEQVVRWMEETRQRTGVTRKQVEERFGTINIGQALFTITPGSTPRVPTLEQVDVLLDLFGLTIDDVPDDIHRLLIDKNASKGQPGPNWYKREVTGQHEAPAAGQQWNANYGLTADLTAKERRDRPATPAAQQWQGWGTALKPAFEPVVVARKPLIGTVAENVLTHGTGALNIDGCRIAATDKTPPPAAGYGRKDTDAAYGIAGDPKFSTTGKDDHPNARWPANVILDESQAAELDRDSLDEGAGASRFFYTAKASSAERPREGDTAHPTVKPLALMRYLVKLITPPGGTVLEPFAGSGTTLEACVVEGFQVIGIELTEEYLPLIVQRVSKPIEQVLL